MERKFKGVWIPAQIWLSKELSLQEKCLIVEIDSFDECWLTNQRLAEFLNVSKDRASKIVSGLVKRGVLNIQVIRDKNTNKVVRRVLKVSDEFKKSLVEKTQDHIGENADTLPVETPIPSRRKRLDPIGENADTLPVKTPSRVIQESNTVRVIQDKDILSSCPDDEEKTVEVIEAEVISDGRTVQLKKKSISESIVEIVEYLNEKAGTHYRSTTPKTQRLIKSRLAEGFTVDDFKTVIDKKCADWLGDGDMVQYLRPDTLFSTKFEGYLNQREADYTKMKPILTKQDKLILQDRMRCKREERNSTEIDREFAKLFSRGGL